MARHTRVILPACHPVATGRQAAMPRQRPIPRPPRGEVPVVRWAAATAYGAQRPTDDADCVVGRERADLDCLGEAMRGLHARLRVADMTDEEAKLLPVQIDGATLADLSIITWMTDAGPQCSDPTIVMFAGRAGRR